MSISILERVTAIRKLAEDSNAQYGYRVRRHERFAGTYCIHFPKLSEKLEHRGVWNNAEADIAYFEALPEALSIINEQARIIFALADELANHEPKTELQEELKPNAVDVENVAKALFHTEYAFGWEEYKEKSHKFYDVGSWMRKAEVAIAEIERQKQL